MGHDADRSRRRDTIDRLLAAVDDGDVASHLRFDGDLIALHREYYNPIPAQVAANG